VAVCSVARCLFESSQQIKTAASRNHPSSVVSSFTRSTDSPERRRWLVVGLVHFGRLGQAGSRKSGGILNLPACRHRLDLAGQI
jgi:hypothetical protein